MNERIKELEKQAIEYSWNQRNSELDLDAIMREKFAELIIRECGLFCGHDYEGVLAMFKHFGVEE